MIFKIHKRNLVNRFLMPIVGAALMAAASTTHARSTYIPIWTGLYPGSSSYSNAQCALCHNSTTSGSSENSYGAAIASSGAGTIGNRIVDVENLDSDADPTESDNLTEINANAQPGWTGTAPTGVTGDLDPAGNQPPVADPGGPYNGIAGIAVAFDGSASFDPDGGNITQYDWDFGDGNTGFGEAPSHIYAADGSYPVTLTVVDDEGALSTPVSTTADIAIDTDGDGIADALDNCILVANGPLIPDAGGNSQLDTDGDGYGNICDADLNQDLKTDLSDFSLFRIALSATNDPAADFDGNGNVDLTDFSLFRVMFESPPGPSGLNP